MSAPSLDPSDLLDLKMMPAWVKEPSGREDYTHYDGEEPVDRAPRHGQRPRGRDGGQRERRPSTGRSDRDKQRPRGGGPNRERGRGTAGERGRGPNQDRGRRDDRRHERPQPPKPEQPLEVAVQFLPRTAVLDNVIAQVKGDALAYSLFFLARSFLEKPQRYEVALKTKPELPLYRLGEGGSVSTDRGSLESSAFRLAGEEFYRADVTQSEPLKGNFTSIARCRLSGVVLGPTNHHDYQRKLRGHYEQRFSRRMNFAEYQRQVEIVNDPAVVEQWKEEARNQTTFVSLKEEPALTFPNASEAERHFRQQYLPGLLRTVDEVVIDGLTSRQLGDRRLGRHIEQAWSEENRSPSHMMQELAKRFREAGLHIFRHRRGMLFVSSIRVRPFAHEGQSVSPQVNAILELVGATPRIRRKEVAEKLLADAGDQLETKKLALASDLRWLISEGFVIEFNDAALDLPRTKPAKPDATTENSSASEAATPAGNSEAKETVPAPEKTQESAEKPDNSGNGEVSELGFA